MRSPQAFEEVKKKPESEQVSFLRGLVETCVRGVAGNEEAVRIECDVMPARVVFSLFVAPSDVGLVLGSDGKTLDAIRRIVWTACKKTDLKVDIDIITNGRR